MDNRKLIDKALEAMNYAYAPYSKFKVGAALITDGVVYTGCNIENSSFGATICAERCAISKAVSEGHKNIQKIVENSIKGVNPFIEYLNKVSIIYNEPIEILMDNNNLYLIEGEN